MTTAVSTRERILQEGINLMSTAGFAGVTLGVLAERTGMSKSGLFAHFGSKEEVQLGLLDRLGVTAGETVIAPAMLAPEGVARLKAVFDHWLGWYKKAGLPGGCPVAAAMFEFDDLDGAVRDRLTEREQEWRGFLAQVVLGAIKQKEFRSDLDVKQFVWELQGIYLSHHASTRFSRDPDADERAHRAFARLLKDAAVIQTLRRRAKSGT